ncbi:hypothetical protein [Chryseobacterium taichungense]|jgi:hypothetical protein|uniref:hypothetical protein n=1 Tax=Chryseobacterium taichungense TaxID=295069 RepID=UPI0028AC9AC0|nr:hypothetical protein [Chryseobacterium taichungense]
MIKISLCILAVYLMYYAGNILYDLFLKKEKENYKEEAEEFSLSEISEQYEDLTKNVGIEDVENLNTPKSFNKNIIHPDSIEGKHERQDLQHLREQFESEQDIDNFQNDEGMSEDQPGISDTLPSHNEEKIPNQYTDKSNLTVSKTNKDKFRNLLNLAETSVQLIANNNGYKTYQSIM